MKKISDFTWNYYIYNVINLNTEEMYETEDFEDARAIFADWHRIYPFDKIIIQQIHSIARRML